MRTPWIRTAEVTSISLVLALAGCASTKEDIFPKDMRPMGEVYDDHFARLRTRGIEGARVRLHAERPQGPPAGSEETHPELAGYTREAHTEIEVLFPTVPNPQLVLYIYPHLGEDGAPVPGYATAFPMYERVEYAAGGGPLSLVHGEARRRRALRGSDGLQSAVRERYQRSSGFPTCAAGRLI